MKARLLLFAAALAFGAGFAVAYWVLALAPTISGMLAMVLSAVGAAAIVLASRDRASW